MPVESHTAMVMIMISQARLQCVFLREDIALDELPERKRCGRRAYAEDKQHGRQRLGGELLGARDKPRRREESP